MLLHILNFVLAWLPPTRFFPLRAFLLRCGGVRIDRSAKYCGRGWVYGRGALEIGEETWLSAQVIFYTHAQATIRIGAACDVGHGVQFITGSHLIGSSSRRAGAGTARSIRVGRGCWIGAGCQIHGGVDIGDGCIIAAGAVVTRSIPANSLAAGVPAKVKRVLPP